MGPDSGVMVDDQIILDSNGNLGVFLRRCMLAFNLLSFEVSRFSYFNNLPLLRTIIFVFV